MEESDALLLPLSRPPPAVRVRAALQLEDRQYDWGYSKAVVALDLVWNTAFVLVVAAVLLSTSRERPSTPIRAWVFGYAVQCLVHMGFVYLEYSRRRRRRMEESTECRTYRLRGGLVWGMRGCMHHLDDRCSLLASLQVNLILFYLALALGHPSVQNLRALKKLESLDAMISFLWWILGFYWIVVGGQTLLQDAPHLYWLAVVFLAFDVFFAIFCIMLACTIGMALCCCLPCIIALLYAVAGQEGASDADLNMLPKFRFRPATRSEEFDPEKGQALAVTVTEAESTDELALSPEDSQCCICLSRYEDGAELLSLPCSHHFHSSCIIKWLRINATCPLCKNNILNNGSDDGLV